MQGFFFPTKVVVYKERGTSFKFIYKGLQFKTKMKWLALFVEMSVHFQTAALMLHWLS